MQKRKKKIVKASKNGQIPFFHAFLLLLTFHFICNILGAVILGVWNINN